MLFGRGQAIENEFPRISRARMLNTIDPESTEIGDGTTAAPTEEEKRWLDKIAKISRGNFVTIPWLKTMSVENVIDD